MTGLRLFGGFAWRALTHIAARVQAPSRMPAARPSPTTRQSGTANLSTTPAATQPNAAPAATGPDGPSRTESLRTGTAHPAAHWVNHVDPDAHRPFAEYIGLTPRGQP